MALILCLVTASNPASAVTLEDLEYDPQGDVIDVSTNQTVDRPGIDMLNIRVDDLSGDLEVSMTLSGAPEVNASYTVNVLVDGTDLFTFSYTSTGGFYGLDPIGNSVVVLGWFDPDRAVWEVSTALLEVGIGLEIDTAYTYVTNTTGELLVDSFETLPPPNDPPTVAITSPADGATVAGLFDVTGTASDDTAVTAVLVRVDDGDWLWATGTDTWNHKVDASTLADGSHTIDVQSSDGSLYSGIVSITVTVNNGGDAPVVSISWPDGHTVSGTITITGTAADDGGVAKVRVRLDGGDWMVATGTNAWSYELDTSSLPDGEHTVEAVAYDEGEQTSPVVTGTFWKGPDPPPENQPPEVTITRPSDIYLVRTWEPYTFNGTASDDGRVMKVEIRLNDEDWKEADLDGDDWTLVMQVRHLDLDDENTLEARAFDGELYSDVLRIILDVEDDGAPSITVRLIEETSDHISLGGIASDSADPIVRIEVKFENGVWVEIPFEAQAGSENRVQWNHTATINNLREDKPYTLYFRAFAGEQYSSEEMYQFYREKAKGGTNPDSFLPAVGPSLVLLAFIFVGMIALHTRRPA